MPASTPVVLLAGGLGTRMREETEFKPKPMVEIGGKPILWHIMKHYTQFGVREFVICLGYRGEVIKDFFLHYREKIGGISVDMKSGQVTMHSPDGHEGWLVHLLETGQETMTGGRVKRAAEFLGNRRFMLTYGDGVSDVDIGALMKFHEKNGKLATLTAVRPAARFGGLQFEGDLISNFQEKPQTGEGWINGGFMVMEPGVANYITEGDPTILERAPMENLTADGELAAYRHEGFWQSMDTLRDILMVREMWDKDRAPWKNW